MVTTKKLGLGILLCLALPLLARAQGLLAVDNPARNDLDPRAYLSIHAFTADDQVAVREYGGDWRGSYAPRAGTNLGVLSVRAESGAQWDGYRLGVLYRAEALVEANRDTSDLVHQYKNKSGYDLGRTYQLDYQVRGFEVDGARLSKSVSIEPLGQWQVQLGVGLAVLRGKRIRLETASGQVVTLNAMDVNAGAHLDDTDSQINVRNLSKFNAPFGRFASPSGQGYAVDVGMVLHHAASGMRIELAAADLIGRIHWKNLPNNVTDYSTATKSYDADGFVQYDPSATRISSYRNLSQKLNPKLWLAVRYPIAGFEFQGATGYTRGYWFPQLALGYHLGQWLLTVDHDLRFHTWMIAMENTWLRLGVRTSNANPDKAKAYGIAGAVHVSF